MLFGGVERRRVDGHHHLAGEIEILVLARGGHFVPAVDRCDEVVNGHLHQFGKLFERVGFQCVFACGCGYPDFFGAVARRAWRPDLIDLVGDVPIDDVVIVGSGLRLDGERKVTVRLVFGRKALAELVDAQIRHELLGVEHDRLRELVFGGADGKAHLVAVARVSESAGEPGARHAARTAAFLEHLLVEFVAAGCEHDAFGAIVLFESFIAFHDDAGHLARVIGNELACGAAVTDLDASLLQNACEDARKIARGIGKVERSVPRAGERRSIPLVAKIGEIARRERQRIIIEVLVVEMADVPVNGFSVRFEPMAVQLHFALERAVDHGIAHPGIEVVGHAPVLVELRVRAADGGRVVVADRLLFDGDGFEPLFGARERCGVARGSEPAYDNVNVVRGHDVAFGNGLGDKGDLAFARSSNLYFFDDGPNGFRGVGRLHGSSGLRSRAVCGRACFRTCRACRSARRASDDTRHGGKAGCCRCACQKRAAAETAFRLFCFGCVSGFGDLFHRFPPGCRWSCARFTFEHGCSVAAGRKKRI